jgi:hypothetical protein
LRSTTVGEILACARDDGGENFKATSTESLGPSRTGGFARDDRIAVAARSRYHNTLLIVITARERHFVGMGEKPKIKIESVTQLAVFLSNRPGALARVCEELAGAKINIHALSISDTADHSVVRMVVSDPTKALMLLGERGVLALETEVLMIETENHPGALGRIAERLAEAEVNIEYAYMAATLNSPNGLMILRPDDVEKAHKVVGNL